MQAQVQERLAVVVREGLKGNHLLFAQHDLLAACDDGAPSSADLPAAERDQGREVNREVARELGGAGLRLVQAASIEEARTFIEGLSAPCRTALARLYLRFLARCAAARGDAS